MHTEDQSLRINPAGKAKAKDDVVIKIKPDPRYYGKIGDLDKRFANGVSSLVDCDSLIIEGDVLFEKDVKMENKVNIRNMKQFQAVIKVGPVIDRDLNLQRYPFNSPTA